MEQSEHNSIKLIEQSRVEDISALDSKEIDEERDEVTAAAQQGVVGRQKWSFKAVVAVISLGLTWIGAQLPIYFMAGTMEYIVADINPGPKASWIPLSFVLSQGTPVPFAGYIHMVGGLSILGVFLTYFPTKHSRMQGMSRRQMLRHIDWTGGALLTIGLTLVCVALQSGGYTHPWTSVYVLCTLLSGVAALIGFSVWEYFVPHYPLLPRELLSRKAVDMAFGVAFISGVFFYSFVNFGPVYFTNVFPRHIPYVMAGFSALMTLAGGLMTLGNPTNPGAVTAFAALAGLGCGGLIVPVATVCVIASPDHLIATTVALTLAFRVLGSTIGYAIYSNILTNKLTAKLPALVAHHAIEAGLPKESLTEFIMKFLATPPDSSVGAIPGVTSNVIAAAALGARWAYAESLKFVFFASIPFGVVAIVLSLFVRNLHKYMTDRVVAHLHS
ncbi:hypothetical protein H2200_012418 [Cladophialophora chaetospira]|uniref:Uncharacterized protein n=1 Tax=Cladophialophora chaetospira TaxID=386627 RepID=A0AA39CCD2_9EURO|nr:hypothetical protein H2200_012418 [Cladophialophora chaetospira]